MDTDMGSYACEYLKRGWYPMPLPPHKKFPPPKGFTGYQRKAVTEADVDAWTRDEAWHNIALGLPSNVVGIDVDDYGDKHGADELEKLQAELGGLPPTWISSSRSEPTRSGIRVYRVPDEFDWSHVSGALSTSIDVIRPQHRYLVAEPSTHPSGSQYRWYDAHSNACDMAPATCELPMLPPRWLQRLAGDPTSKADKALADAISEQHNTNGRSHYDAMVSSVMRLCALNASTDSLRKLKRTYATVIDRDTGCDEFDRALAGARAKISTERDGDHVQLRATDLELCDEVIRRHGDRLRYAIDQQRWFSYADGRWDSVGGHDIAQKLTQQTIRDVNAYQQRADGTKTDATSWLHAASRVSSALDHVRRTDATQVHGGEFNSDSNLFNVANGTIELTTGQLRAHDPADLITQQSPVEYRPDATCPQFDRFLREVQPDADIRSYLARLFGCALLGDVREHKFAVLTGTGRNGKSVLVKIISAVFGEYATGVNKELLTLSRHEGHLTAVASLYGRRLAVAQELDRDARWDVSRVKELTGGDRLTARRMREDEWNFEPSHTLVMTSNHAPNVGSGEHAFWSRCDQVPFEQSFEGREDPLLAQRIIDTESSGVLAWLVRGLHEYLRTGLGTPDAVREATRESREDSEPLLRFADESLEITGDPNDELPTKLVWDRWQLWLATQSDIIRSPKYARFSRELRAATAARGGSTAALELARGRHGGQTCVSLLRGCRLKPSAAVGAAVDDTPTESTAADETAGHLAIEEVAAVDAVETGISKNVEREELYSADAIQNSYSADNGSELQQPQQPVTQPAVEPIRSVVTHSDVKPKPGTIAHAIAEFAADTLTRVDDDDVYVHARDVWSAWLTWCHADGRQQRTGAYKSFARAIGAREHKRTGTRYVYGRRWRAQVLAAHAHHVDTDDRTVSIGLLADGRVNPDYRVTPQHDERGTERVTYNEYERRMRLAGAWRDHSFTHTETIEL
ncbi:phage/plasmid primase, P4 family [Pseudonocardia sp. ICBG1142]|uniref:phage/plasmid primase, P4 family n=1 Tax=Pseudonocardia sp. ICBG1142 TaxID=2846760 RepID=UPI001CF71672|nr:phage/plasmid primase, P4 family [Pseudonocardia sp. ICBG1142]